MAAPAPGVSSTGDRQWVSLPRIGDGLHQQLSLEEPSLFAALDRPGDLFRGRRCLHGRARGPGSRDHGQRLGRGRCARRPSAAHYSEPVCRSPRGSRRSQGRPSGQRPRADGSRSRTCLRQGSRHHLWPGLPDGTRPYYLQPHDPGCFPERGGWRRSNTRQRPHQRHVQRLGDGRSSPRGPAGGDRKRTKTEPVLARI
jgi:hypothetical protein